MREILLLRNKRGSLTTQTGVLEAEWTGWPINVNHNKNCCPYLCQILTDVNIWQRTLTLTGVSVSVLAEGLRVLLVLQFRIKTLSYSVSAYLLFVILIRIQVEQTKQNAYAMCTIYGIRRSICGIIVPFDIECWRHQQSDQKQSVMELHSYKQKQFFSEDNH